MTALPAYADAKAKPPTAPHAQAPKTTGKPATADKPATAGKPTTSSTSTTTASNTSSTTTTPALNPIAAKISSKPQLNTKITGMLPGGISLDRASNGFKNQGQFIAALHAAQNLGCVTATCFMKFKADMVQNGMSLGQAIQHAKATANATTEAQHAESQANDDLSSAGSTSSGQGSTTVIPKNKNKKKTTQASGVK